MDQFRCDPCFSVKFFILFLTSFMGKHWGQLNPPGWQKEHHVQKQPSRPWLGGGVFLGPIRSLQKASSVTGMAGCSCGARSAPWGTASCRACKKWWSLRSGCAAGEGKS